MTQKETRVILAEYERAGFTVTKTAHWKVFDGPRLVTVLSGSQCGGRAEANARAVLRRAVRERTQQGKAA